ncbi:MAG: glycosyltransferase family 2 protein [Prolixibacteraceae bacterium]|nr:glycosyltransferase family 2 protein [Prolixibacteraceae bacterium]
MEISVIIPVFNENGIIEELIGRTTKALNEISSSYEIIIVDDGSSDGSLQQLIKYTKSNNRIKVIVLSRNFGHQHAYTAGLKYASGDYVAMIDGDLQDPPELLPVMYRKLISENNDIISGKRTSRKGNIIRNCIISSFHSFFKKAVQLKGLKDTGNFCIMNCQALNALLSMKEKTRYLPGMRNYIGFKQDYVEYIRENRLKGKSKMSTVKLCLLAADAIFSFSHLPIRLCFFIGFFGAFISLIAGAYALYVKIAGVALKGWSSTVMSIYFIGSIQLIFLGIIGEYIYRIYKESQKRPLYFIKKIYDQEKSESPGTINKKISEN